MAESNVDQMGMDLADGEGELEVQDRVGSFCLWRGRIIGPVALSPPFVWYYGWISFWFYWLALPMKINFQHLSIWFHILVIVSLMFFFSVMFPCVLVEAECSTAQKLPFFFDVQINRSLSRSVCHIWPLSNNPVVFEYFIRLAVNH